MLVRELAFDRYRRHGRRSWAGLRSRPWHCLKELAACSRAMSAEAGCSKMRKLGIYFACLLAVNSASAQVVPRITVPRVPIPKISLPRVIVPPRPRVPTPKGAVTSPLMQGPKVVATRLPYTSHSSGKGLPVLGKISNQTSSKTFNAAKADTGGTVGPNQNHSNATDGTGAVCPGVCILVGTQTQPAEYQGGALTNYTGNYGGGGYLVDTIVVGGKTINLTDGNVHLYTGQNTNGITKNGLWQESSGNWNYYVNNQIQPVTWGAAVVLVAPVTTTPSPAPATLPPIPVTNPTPTTPVKNPNLPTVGNQTPTFANNPTQVQPNTPTFESGPPPAAPPPPSPPGINSPLNPLNGSTSVSFGGLDVIGGLFGCLSCLVGLQPDAEHGVTTVIDTIVGVPPLVPGSQTIVDKIKENGVENVKKWSDENGGVDYPPSVSGPIQPPYRRP
jgi:hypothetical protein